MIAWIENVADLANVNDVAGADRVIVNADEAAIVYLILISRKLNDPVTGGTVIVIVIVIVNGGGREAMIVIATGIVSETNVTEIAIVERGKIATIVRMRTRKKSELKRSP